MKFTKEELEQVFAESGSSRYEKFSSELVNANYLVLLSGAEEFYTYDLRSGAVAALPPTAFTFRTRLPGIFPARSPRGRPSYRYYAKLSKLSLGSVL